MYALNNDRVLENFIKIHVNSTSDACRFDLIVLSKDRLNLRFNKAENAVQT